MIWSYAENQFPPTIGHDHPLRRARIIRAVAVAAGRASPDVQYDGVDLALEARTAPTADEAEARGELILVAEDNVTNQDVILRQIAVLGYAADVAGDGQEAMKALRTKTYALLLTDCHMPNMDGYELAKTIRKSEKKGGARMPIVAITAAALRAEVDRCFEAGMDDYLPKPLEIAKLKNTLRNWMPAPLGGVVVDEIAAAPPATDQEGDAEPKIGGPVDPSALINIFGDDPDTIREILAEFAATAWPTVAGIEDAVERKLAQNLGTLCHDFKSSSRTIGAIALSELCATLERAGKDDDWATIERDTPKLRGFMSEVAEFIDEQS